MAAFGKNSGASRLANALGLLRIFGRDLPKAEGIVEKLPTESFRGTTKPGVYPGQGDGLKIGYFVGCGVDVIQVHAGKATFEELKKIGKSVTVLDNCCCGLPPWSYGDLENTKKLALKNLKVLSEADVDVIVTDCSSCASFLKEYEKVFKDDPTNLAVVEKTASLFQDSVEFLATRGEKTAKAGEEGEVVGAYYDPHGAGLQDGSVGTGTGSDKPIVMTYHDPCHAVRGQGIKDEGRDILKKLPNVEFREMKEADWCCGGAGSYALTHYDLSQKVLDRKMKNLKNTDADILVTSCPACMIQLSFGIRRHGLKTKVFHISEIVTHIEETETA